MISNGEAEFPAKSEAEPAPLSDVETLRGIIDAVPHPIFVKDSESRFLIVNAAMCHFMERDTFETIPPEAS